MLDSAEISALRLHRRERVPASKKIGSQEVVVVQISKSLCRAAATGAAALLTASAVAGLDFNKPADIDAITAIEGQLAKLNTMKELIRYYAPEAVVYDAYAPGVYRGTKQIFDGFELQFAQGQGFTGAIPDMNVLSDGKFACAAMQLHFDFTMKNGTQGTITLRQLDAFKKIGGKWLIVQQHISFPMDPKTGKGLLDAPMPVRGPLNWNPKSFVGPATAPAQAKREVRSWLDVGVLARNLDELMSYYGPTDDVIVYDMLYPPGEFRGKKEFRDGFAPVMNYTDPQVKMLDFVVDSDGVFAVQIDAQDVTVKRKDGTRSNFLLRQSDCLRRMDGKWYSVLEAISVPVDAKTGQSVTIPSVIAFD
jgi:ketosteroid isomerase-like protein